MWRTLKEMTLKPSIAVHASGKQSSRTKADYFQGRMQGGGTAVGLRESAAGTRRIPQEFAATRRVDQIQWSAKHLLVTLSINRLRGHVPQRYLPNSVMDQKRTSGQLPEATSTGRAFHVNLTAQELSRWIAAILYRTSMTKKVMSSCWG